MLSIWRSNEASLKDKDSPKSYARMQRGKNWSISTVLKNFDKTNKEYTYKDTHMPGILPFIPKEWWHTLGYYQTFLSKENLKKLELDRNNFLLAFHRSPNVCVEDYDNLQKWLVKSNMKMGTNPFLDKGSSRI